MTEDGRFYVTRDYVEGERIDEYCDKRCLDIPTRLRLFTQVCAAIQFAHQHAMIHYNLKPSNILVTPGGSTQGCGPGNHQVASRLMSGTVNTTIGSNATRTAPVSRC